MRKLLPLLAILCAPLLAQKLTWSVDPEAPWRAYSWTRTVLEGADVTPGLPTRPGCVLGPDAFEDDAPHAGVTRVDLHQPSPELFVMRGLLAASGKRLKKRAKWSWSGAQAGLSGSLAFKVGSVDDERAVIAFEGQGQVAERSTTEPAIDIAWQGELVFSHEHGALEAVSWRQHFAWLDRDGNPQRRVEELTGGPPAMGLFAELIEGAIARGRENLLAELEKMRKSYPRSRLDRQLFYAFALLRAGLPGQHETVQAVFDTVAKERETSGSYLFLRTYGLSLYLMALEARAIERIPPEVIDGSATAPRFQRLGIDPADLAAMRQATEELLRWRLGTKGSWTYGPGNEQQQAGDGDNSNSQFAILGLHSAVRSGVPVNASIWPELDVWWRKHIATAPGGDAPLRVDWLLVDSEAEAEGTISDELFTGTYPSLPPKGWGYTMATRSGAYLSMTAAGLSSIATIRDGLGLQNSAAELQRDTEIMQGLAGLASLDAFREDAQISLGGHYFYYALYSLEKALDMLGVEALDDFAWYPELSAWLLGAQAPAGHWEPHKPLSGTITEYGVDTAFALLVLTRATLASNPEFTPSLEVGRLATGEEEAPDVVYIAELGERIALTSAAALLAAGGHGEEAEKAEVALEEGLELLAPEHRPVMIPRLLDLLEARDSGHRRLASRALKDIARPLKAKEEELRQLHADWEGLRAAEVDPAHARAVLLDADRHPALRMLAADALGTREGRAAADALLLGMQAKEEEVRAHCVMVLRRETGQAFGYDPEGSRRERGEALDAWRAWLGE